MLLQGDLQKVFDALYHLGVIDPVLDLDWSQEFARIEENPEGLLSILKVVSEDCGSHHDLMGKLESFQMEDLTHLAMLVAKELASSQIEKTLH